MSAVTRRARLLAFVLDLFLCAAAADLAGLGLTALLWNAGVRGPAILAAWAAVAAGAIAAFLLRDARGGRAKRWLAFGLRDASGRPPGSTGSIRRNLPLLVPVWNLFQVLPILRDGGSARPADRGRGLSVVALD